MIRTTIAALAAVVAISLTPMSALACPTCGNGGLPTPSYPNPGPFPPGVPNYPNPGPFPPGTGSPIPQHPRPPILVQIQVIVPVPVPVYEWRWEWSWYQQSYQWVRVRVGTRIEYRTEWRWVTAKWHAPWGCHRYMDGSGTWQRLRPNQTTRPMSGF